MAVTQGSINSRTKVGSRVDVVVTEEINRAVGITTIIEGVMAVVGEVEGDGTEAAQRTRTQRSRSI